MYKVREEEPAYAFVPPPAEDKRVNQYGKPIQLVDENDPLAGQSLKINGDASVGANPNRYKQHGFHFSADHCIGCHACEAACSEKNDLPAHLSFRSVGYVEGGTFPDYRRLNISMACNHCDDPVCLKGCPTRAYTKFAEYGAVLQDPDICFGCGYCTWVCPYNAPQLDPVKGQVSKCNMCVDRLEVGLKPACAAACLGGALDFGVIETAPEHREETKLAIPGFPTPEITHPNIRFQQTAPLPEVMTRPDTMPLRYVRKAVGNAAESTPPLPPGERGAMKDFSLIKFLSKTFLLGEEGKKSLLNPPHPNPLPGGEGIEFRPVAADKKSEPQWNLRKLRSREDPLVIFTLLSQAVIGAFLLLYLGPWLGLDVLSATAHPATYQTLLFGLLGLESVALGLSTMHLGKPHRFYRAFNNLKYSPVSREVAALSVFYGALFAYAVLTVFPIFPVLRGLSGFVAAAAGPVALYAMYRIYRIPARPFWDHWQTATSFYGNMLTLGALAVGLAYGLSLAIQGVPASGLLAALAWPLALGLAIEGVGLLAHRNYLLRRGGEAAASRLEQATTFGKTTLARNGGLALGLVLALALGGTGAAGLPAWLLLTTVVLATAVVGRALFYVLVVPTTMPGAFFWRNRGFEEHARETGLAKMPQVGVLPGGH